jgi:hypothetical protein
MAQPIPFLELPAEIRIMCHSYMTPIDDRPEEYNGLSLLQAGEHRDGRRMRQVHALFH